MFISKTNANLTEFSQNLKNIKNSLLSENLDFNLINQNQKILINYELLIVNKEYSQNNDDYLDIFTDLI